MPAQPIFRRMMSPSYLPEAKALFSAMTLQPSGARKSLIDRTIRSLKAGGVWSALDALYVTAAHDEQAAKINWKDPGTYDLTAVNSPTFTTDRGFAGDGSTSYLKTGFNPATAGGNFAAADGHASAWSLTSRATAVYNSLIGAQDGTKFIQIGLNWPGANSSFRINDAGGLLNGYTTTDGHFVEDRVADTKAAYRNTTNLSAPAAANNGLVSLELYIGARNSSGTPDQYSTDQIASATIGGGLGTDRVAALYDALNTYMGEVGAV